MREIDLKKNDLYQAFFKHVPKLVLPKLPVSGSIRSIFIFIFLIAVLLLSGYALQNIKYQTKKNTVQTLQTVLKTTQESIHNWTNHLKHGVLVLSLSPALINLTKEQLTVLRNRKNLLDSPALVEIRAFFQENLKTFEDGIGFFVVSPDFINIASMQVENVGKVNIVAINRKDRLLKVFQGKTQFILQCIQIFLYQALLVNWWRVIQQCSWRVLLRMIRRK